MFIRTPLDFLCGTCEDQSTVRKLTSNLKVLNESRSTILTRLATTSSTRILFFILAFLKSERGKGGSEVVGRQQQTLEIRGKLEIWDPGLKKKKRNGEKKKKKK
ncbi:hypothetical protein I7I53_10051 [Histoplasma capsulatum var. duboisii H88]|uniref:Uncharacterized protein n=1 Tax=Ajellomyces capsulatus (strain H88) TaxID=544711 RepID=A0A8A1LC94_AJEC8|nr:hypothetical protein I7I53_10051 [Histoplasma capsulatum var. duboisii H88]